MKKLTRYCLPIGVVFILLFSQEMFAQSVVTVNANGHLADCTEVIPSRSGTEHTVNTIAEEDYPYLRSLDCLTSGYFTENLNLDLQLRNMSRWDNSHYVLTGNGATINVEASYDWQGNLIEATLVTKDTQIPVPILRYIYSEQEFAGWVMVSNEKVVKDFDPYQTEYRVTLSKNGDTEVLQFREQGEMIALVD